MKSPPKDPETNLCRPMPTPNNGFKGQSGRTRVVQTGKAAGMQNMHCYSHGIFIVHSTWYKVRTDH